MHVLKSAVSGLLLLTSIFWLGIQHIFLTPEVVNRILSVSSFNNVRNKPAQSLHQQQFDFLQLRRDWCRVKSKKIAWREIVGVCQNKDYFMQDKRYVFLNEMKQKIKQNFILKGRNFGGFGGFGLQPQN